MKWKFIDYNVYLLLINNYQNEIKFNLNYKLLVLNIQK